MARQTVSEAEIIQMTLENVRSFYSRAKDVTTTPMTDDFMWIGSNDFQWCEGLDEFYRVTKKEYDEPPVLLSDEQYHLLFHERNVWVVYGRYTATVVSPDGSVLYAHVRGTYVWRRINGEIKLAHVHGSHAQDIPLNQLAPAPTAFTAESDFFDYMMQMDAKKREAGSLLLRDRAGEHRVLQPHQILYMKAAGLSTFVNTRDGSFLTPGLLGDFETRLAPQFRRIHKSYLVNTQFITSICRYKAVLMGGQALPISKERYMELKRYLQTNKA